jgi:ABC-type microcin C transport system permease subunit YejE
MLIVGGIMKEVSSMIGLPYTSLITIIGVVLGVLAEGYPHLIGGECGKLDLAIHAYSSIPPHFLLLVFLPALIFESAFNSDWHIFKA